jgi:Mn2+/Fe2+ NRAMP family transporter
VLVSMIVIISKLDINWGKALGGFVPSKSAFAGDSIYTCEGIFFCRPLSNANKSPFLPAVGIIGATVMVSGS